MPEWPGYGWINRTLPAGEPDAFVATLAANRCFPDGVIAAAKLAVPHVDLADGFKRESKAG